MISQDGQVGPLGPKGDTGTTVPGPTPAGTTRNCEQRTQGVSIQWLGSFASHPVMPSKPAYHNTTQKKSFVYDGTQWQ